MPTGAFFEAYRELEQRMKALASADGDVFLPNPEPEAPVHYVLVCMEPSLGRWAPDPNAATSRVESGFRNFLPSDEVALLHFCVRRYLCRPGERYHLTDFSTGAMPVERAGPDRVERYRRWFSLLMEEISLVARPDARIIAARRQLFLPVGDNYFCRRKVSKGVLPTTWQRSVVVVGRSVAVKRSAGAPTGA